MSVLEKYLAKGWRIIGGRTKGSGGKSKVQCPVEGCGVTLEITHNATPTGQTVEVDQMADLSMVIANRRYSLGLTADDIDDCAGLGHRHMQKVEDCGRNIGQGKTISPDVMLSQLLRVLDEGLTPDMVLVLERMIATRTGIDGKSPPRPRVPTVDTLLLIVQAMGGRLLIDWGQPPRITQRLMDSSFKVQRVETPR